MAIAKGYLKATFLKGAPFLSGVEPVLPPPDGPKWDDGERNILDDLVAAKELLRAEADAEPPVVLMNYKQCAAYALGVYLYTLKRRLRNALSYTLPEFTLWDNIKDCYHWRRP